jgi:hypothetical protein
MPLERVRISKASICQVMFSRQGQGSLKVTPDRVDNLLAAPIAVTSKTRTRPCTERKETIFQNRADKKQAKQPRGDGSRIEKQMERACQVAKSRPWIGLYKHCVVSRANEMDCGKYQAHD